MKNLFFIVAALFVLSFLACGGKKDVEDYYETEYEVEGNPEKVAFLEDFYEKYFQNFNDPDALVNLVSDKLTPRADSIIKKLVGDNDDSMWKAFKPVVMDSIPESELTNMSNKIFVTLHEDASIEDDNETNNYYDVVIEDMDVLNHTIMLYVVGSNGDFKIDSISNPDYEKKDNVVNDNTPEPEIEKVQ